MNKIIGLILLVAATSAQADMWVNTPVLTYHESRRRDTGEHWNENQHKEGLAWGVEFGRDDLSVIGGRYLNSYFRKTNYAGAKWMPLHAGPVRFGAVAGYASGYWRKFPVLAGLSASLTDERGNGLLLIGVPKTLPDTSAFINVQLRLRVW